MAAIDFPLSPTDGQTFTANGLSYVYNSTYGVWRLVSSPGGGGGGAAAGSLGELSDINLIVQPEQITLNVDAPQAGHAPVWLWTWEQSTLPFSRLPITNSPQLSVPLYQQGTYQINSFAHTVHGEMTQAHSFKLKWIEGAGDANLVDWVTTTEVTHSHPEINGGADTLVQRLSFTVPSTITPPTLTAPIVSYTVANSQTESAWSFSGTQVGSNPDLGPFYRGGTYTINVNASGHPFYFTTDNGTGFVSESYVGEYTTGVTGSRTDVGTITFVVPSNAPDVLYYQCGVHSSMRGSIQIKDLAVETNDNGNYIIYGQHSQDDHVQPIEIRPLPELASQMCIVYDSILEQWMPQDLATYVENTPSFENKIRDVAGTATLVAPDGTSLVASVEIYSTASYLPQIGNTNGDIAFVEDTQELKVWKQTGANGEWLDIVAGGGGGGGGSPFILSCEPTSFGGEVGTEFTVRGAFFDVGTVVHFIDSAGTSWPATTSTLIGNHTITATTPKDFLSTDGPLDVKIVSGSGSTYTATDMIQTGGAPIWQNPAGTLYENAWADDVANGLNSYRVMMDLNETLLATDADNQAITYAINSGSLPPNGVLDPVTGAITGTLPNDIGADTTYSFTASASDTVGNIATRNFNIIVRNEPGANNYLWTTTGIHNATLTPGNYVMFMSGAGGNGASGPGGAGGWMPYRITISQTTDIIIGVGAAGNGQSYGNAAGYLMRGGTGGNSNYSAGGGGSFVSVDNVNAVTDYYTVSTYNLIAASGGGGGGANHSYTANFGGVGYGYAGGAYNSSYPPGGYAGTHGYNSTGGGGSAQSSGASGGSASSINNCVGGNGGANSNGGGGGGGGAGGGAGGAGGSSGAYGGSGGYLNASGILFNARGGGGGGSHGNSCGGNGGGGGSLYFNNYNFGSLSLSVVGNGQTQAVSNQGWHGTVSTYMSNLGSTTVWSAISGKGQGGSNNSNGVDGFVFIGTEDVNPDLGLIQT